MKPETIPLDDDTVLAKHKEDVEILKACNKGDAFRKLYEGIARIQCRAYVLGYKRGVQDTKAEQEQEKPE